MSIADYLFHTVGIRQLLFNDGNLSPILQIDLHAPAFFCFFTLEFVFNLPAVQVKQKNFRFSFVLPIEIARNAGDGTFFALDPAFIEGDGRDGEHVIDRTVLPASRARNWYGLDVVMVVQ